MKKWIQKGAAAVLAASLLLLQALPANAAERPAKQEESLKIAVLSDTHYLSPEMIADTADFTAHLNSDRKMFAQSEAFLNALLDTVKKDSPDVLLISGDLTKDGEKEGHEALAEILETFKKETGAKVYITPGNHDLNNENAMNFNTESGAAEPAGRTTQEAYKSIYADLVYRDDSVIETFTPAEGNQGGGLSYAARPKDGFTILSIDSARYSADNTDSGKDEHETSGAIGADLEKWVLRQIKAAKERGDTVIGLQHHGLVPHFSMEPELLPMYLVNDYERISEVFADAGMQYIFTGHMHANDIAAVTTEKGSTLYDIETGSVVTYPSPARSVTITRTIENGTVSESMDVKTHTGVNAGTFLNPQTGEKQTIEDMTAYGKAHGFSDEMLSTTVNGFLHPYYAQILEAGGSKKAVEALIGDLLGDSLPIKDLTLEKLIDVGLPLLLPDASSGGEIYYDVGEGGLIVNKKISFVTLNVVVPNAALKETLNLLLQKLDNEILAKPEVLDEIVEDLIASLTSIPVSAGSETPKTLLDYANYIYQSHLGGEDSGAQPAWVSEAAAKIESGELLETVLVTVISKISDIAGKVLASLPLEELLGADGWDNTAKEFHAAQGRIPLVRPTESGKTTLAAALVVLGWKDTDKDGILSMPEGSNPEVGYSVADFLKKLGGLGLKLDINDLLTGLLLGTPAEGETPAEEGLIDAELKGQLNGWLLGVVSSMGVDSNYQEDNNTTITYAWKLLTDRAALDAAIEKAEKLDLSRYTDITAKAVTDAMSAAKALSQTAAQKEMDAAAKALNDAVDALKEKAGADTEEPGNSGGQTPDDKNPTAPETGDTGAVLLLVFLTLSGGFAALALARKKKTLHR